MFDPPLPLLREVVSPTLSAARAELIKHSSTPAAVYRLFLDWASAAGESKARPRTLIAKRVFPDWPDDATGHLREVRFYAEIGPQLPIPQPKIYYAGNEPGTENALILIEDVATSHIFPPPEHCWTMREIRPILAAYAAFHKAGRALLPPQKGRVWLLPRHEQRLFDTASDLPQMMRDLVDNDTWPQAPGFNTLLESTLAAAAHYIQEPATLIHNDVFPPNAALPKEVGGDVLLFDWEMLSWGLPEMDLAFMFLQPFRSDRRLDRAQALQWYWQERERIEIIDPDPEAREARQRYADALWFLWLIPVAHRAATRPFAENSFPRHYWESMLAVMGRRLVELSSEQ